jgi:Na+-transporting methylmalonyl-CoA/oxaloacetate decarboxylase gamma subunit
MNFEQQVQLSLTVLLTGLVIVFAMLVVLTFIIKGYGAAVRKIQKQMKGQSAGLPAVHTPAAFVPASKPKAVPAAEAGIPAEGGAAISAAVYMMYGTSEGTVTSIRRAAQPNRSAWSMAGLLENTRPF